MNTPEITLLITHYNRSDSLERLLKAFRDLGCSFGGIVVSDDASKPEHIEKLKALADKYALKLVTASVNKGLGNNLNKGQDAVKTPYTLYVQEDFWPTPKFPERLETALSILKERPDLDIARLYAHKPYPYRKSYRDGFSEMLFRVLRPGTAKFFFYSDTPHLRRSSFFDRFGRYAEGLPAIKGEKRMVMSVLQSKGRAVECDVSDIFVHENSEAEPSTQDYSAFFRIKSMFPEPLFDTIWTAKLTAELLLRRYRD